MRRRTLLLLRHAEAEPAGPGQRDRDRPLTAQGRADAEEMGRVLASRGFSPDLAMTSDARRAVETMLLLVRQLDRPPRELVVPEIYSAGEDDLLRWTRRSGETVTTLLIVGHNPSIYVFARWLAQQGDARAASRLGTGYPPAALAVFDLRTSAWADFDPSHAELRQFLLPGRAQ